MRYYELALGTKVDALLDDVERLMDLGYIPQGGIAISEAYGRLAQAMVIRSVPPELVDTATVTLYPTDVTVPVRGGSGSVNLTITAPGTWQVDPESVPDWATISPLGEQNTDLQILYTCEANMTGDDRSAVINVNTATLTINQGT